MTLEKAVILESLDTTISVAAFFVPGSWGAQEGGYILIGQMLGLPAHLSLSLSFVKRIPDFLLAFSFGRYLKRAMYPPGRASAMKNRRTLDAVRRALVGDGAENASQIRNTRN